MKNDLQIKIGLEVHCQLTSLRTKLFCSCPSNYRNSEPNTNICPICTGLPGSLPSINEQAIKDGIKAALAVKANIADILKFYRKNYFYPDLPKNFQISQYNKAGGVTLASKGVVEIKGRRIHLSRIQIEEDPAKISYEGTISSSPYSLIDYNRAGITLVEIITEPELKTPRQARLFLQKLRSILEHIGVCDGGLEGAIRCDANISIKGGKRVEIKNIGSFKEVERALNFEATRQKTIKNRNIVGMETRHWDDVRRVTVSMRVKEEEQDYRYFPEVDLVPFRFEKKFINSIKKTMSELPDARRERFAKEIGVSPSNAEVLTSDKALADFFEKCLEYQVNPKRTSNWIVSDVLGFLNREDIEVKQIRVTPKEFAKLIRSVEAGKISEQTGKKLLLKTLTTKDDALQIKETMFRISDPDEVNKIVEKVFNENKKAVEDAVGNKNTINYLMGLIMKATSSRADPKITRKAIDAKLSTLR